MFSTWNMTSLFRSGSRRWPRNWQDVDSIEWVCRWGKGGAVRAEGLNSLHTRDI